jgi:hypothetical protein
MEPVGARRAKAAGGSGSTSPDEVLERPAAGPNGFGRRLTQGPTVVITRRTTYQNRPTSPAPSLEKDLWAESGRGYATAAISRGRRTRL